MFRLDRISKDYREAGSFNEQVNLFGFIDDQVFLTKSGDAGVILSVRGVDYECLESSAIDNLTKRLESAFRIFDEKCRVYQYLFKANGERIPYQTYGSPVVDTAIENRIAFLRGKAESLYALQIYFVILFEGFRYKQALTSSLARLGSSPREAWKELKAYLCRRNQVILIDSEIEKARSAVLGKARNFILQVSDFCSVEILDKHEAFRVLKRILNFDSRKIECAHLKHDAFLDWHLSESHLECHRGHLRLDDYFVKVLTLKEPSAQSFPLIFKKLLEVEANYYVVTEWKKQPPDKSRSLIHSRRRHFHNTKRSLMSHLTLSDHPQQTDDILIDDSKEAQVRDLGLALKELELNGNYFGEFSLTVVVYDLDLAKMERACADFYKVFSVADGELYEERYNLLNAYLATLPGNYAFNLRKMLILNTNCADYSFLFTLHCGDPRNQHLKQEYLAVLETNHKTPYYLNLHHRDVAHTMILGKTGAGKSFLLNFLITNLQKYAPYTFIFDLGGSFESLTQLFHGAYVQIGMNAPDFRKGKPLNTYGLTKKVIYENEEFHLLQAALNIEDGLDGLRYNKIVIATDADVDGMHIRLLLLSFFLQFFPDVIRNNHLFILQTPLFRVRNKKKTMYCYSEQEKQAAVEELGASHEITRFKGLGEISAGEFKDFIGENIRLDPINLHHLYSSDELLSFFMGKNTPERQDFIIDNLRVEKDLVEA